MLDHRNSWIRQLTGGSAGRGFLGGAGGREEESGFPGGDDDDIAAITADDGGEGEDASVPLYGTALMYLAGLFLVVTLLAWASAYLADHSSGTTADHAPSMDRSGLAKRARLSGLTLPERRTILRDHVFAEAILYTDYNNDTDDDNPEDSIRTGTTTPTGDDNNKNRNRRGNAGQNASNRTDEDGKGAVVDRETSPDIEAGVTTTEDHSETTITSEPAAEVDVIASDDDDRNGRLCCICLTEYQNGDRLLRGQSPGCGHRFHYECCMHWLMKPHDDCPYCRRSLVSADAFRQGAIRCLGIQRVEQATTGTGTLEMTAVATTVPSSTNPTSDVETPSDGPSSAADEAVTDETRT